MAKLKAPLLSLGASGAIGKALVFFPWKGLNVAREYVTPANPQTDAQNTHRAYLTEVVAAIHTLQGLATDPMIEIDTSAYSLWGSIFATPRTWFNQAVKNNIDQRVAALRGCLYRDGAFTPGAAQVTCHLEFTKISGANNVTAGNWRYGTSKTALINSAAGTIVADSIDNVIAGLTTGIKYYFQFRPSAHADYVGAFSGIYYATPT